MDSILDPIQDQDINDLLAWFQTPEGVAFCLAHMQLYGNLRRHGLDAQRSVSELSDELLERLKIFLVIAEMQSPFNRRTFFHIPTMSAHVAQLERSARERLVEAVVAKMAAVDAAVGTHAARDASQQLLFTNASFYDKVEAVQAAVAAALNAAADAKPAAVERRFEEPDRPQEDPEDPLAAAVAAAAQATAPIGAAATHKRDNDNNLGKQASKEGLNKAAE